MVACSCEDDGPEIIERRAYRIEEMEVKEGRESCPTTLASASQD